MLVMLLLGTIIRAEDWITTDGKTYNNIRILSHDSTVVTVSFNNSTSPISASALSNAVQQGILGSVTLPISSLDKVIRQTVLDDHTTALNKATSGGNEDKYVKAVTDLCSQSPEVRSKAAVIIRENHLYRPTRRDLWDKLATEMKVGEAFSDVINYLHKRGVALQLPASFTPPKGVLNFRLDDSWVLLCAVDEGFLTDFAIREEPIQIQVSPPEEFSGLWRTYRINGEAVNAPYFDKGRRIFLIDN
jgi:hypothetical protein